MNSIPRNGGHFSNERLPASGPSVWEIPFVMLVPQHPLVVLSPSPEVLRWREMGKTLLLARSAEPHDCNASVWMMLSEIRTGGQKSGSPGGMTSDLFYWNRHKCNGP